MALPFDQDFHPGSPKILFIGLGNSSHTHSWIDLLTGSDFNVRLFAVPESSPPNDWKVKTYISGAKIGDNSAYRYYLYSGFIGILRSIYYRIATKLSLEPKFGPEALLAEIIRQWQPDIIHTLGMFDKQGGYFYYQVREKYKLQNFGKWILQTRGGSDLSQRRQNPEMATIIRNMFDACHQIISDNTVNIRYAQDLGIAPVKFAGIVPVPGTGGIAVEELSKDTVPASKRERIILWPKAYESQWSKARPVLEAIQLAWDKIYPCEIYMLATTPEVRINFLFLPKKIRQNCHIYGRIARDDVLKLMKRSRLLLIPSQVDGIPNSLYEAMAAGAFPIVSPLETIRTVVDGKNNVLFANNLDPEEISAAIVRAMTDDDLVDQVAQNNFKLVERIALRSMIKKKVIKYYLELIN
jgi:hypothetical protein